MERCVMTAPRTPVQLRLLRGRFPDARGSGSEVHVKPAAAKDEETDRGEKGEAGKAAADPNRLGDVGMQAGERVTVTPKTRQLSALDGGRDLPPRHTPGDEIGSSEDHSREEFFGALSYCLLFHIRSVRTCGHAAEPTAQPL